MIFAEILFAHHVVFWADRTSVSLTITDAKAFLGVLSYVVHHFICVDFGCFILNCEMIYYICTFIAATHTHPLSRLSLLARARHYTSILLRHLSNASACHLFAYFFFCLFYLFVLFPHFLAQKQSRYVCDVRWLLDMQTQFIFNCLWYEWMPWKKTNQNNFIHCRLWRAHSVPFTASNQIPVRAFFSQSFTDLLPIVCFISSRCIQEDNERWIKNML